MAAIKIDVQRTDIEFDFAGKIVQADASDANIAEMLDLKDSDLQDKANAELAKVKDQQAKDITKEDFESMIQTCIDLYGAIYAPVFGQGSFQDVYAHIKSVTATINAFESAFDYIVDEVERRNEQHQKKKEQKIAKYKKRMK